MLAKFSVKKPYTVIVGIILVIALGVISFTHMTSDLLPSMDLPYIIVYTSYTGATPEKVESEITRPMEAAFATLTDVKGLSSTSSENLSLVVMEFESGADMNTAMIEINSQVELLSGGWDDSVGTPMIMKLNPDMLPVTISTVSLEDADLLELSDYVQDELISKYEAVDGVARVTASGILTQQVDITIEQNRIDALNNAILAEVDEDLAEVELELRDAMSQLSSGKRQLSRARKQAYAQIDEALAAIDAGTQQMPMAIETLTAQRAELDAQLEGAQAALSQLEGLVNLSDEEKAQISQAADALSALELQRQQLQQQLDSLGGESGDALLARLQDAQKEREEQAALKAAQQQYIEDLKLLDAGSLKETIDRLEAEIAANEAELSDVRSQLETAITNRDAARREVDDLTARIAAMEEAQATATSEATAEVTAAPEATEEAAATPETTEEATFAPETTEEAAAADPATQAAAEQSAAPDDTADPAAADENKENLEAAEPEPQGASLLDNLLGGNAAAEG